MGMARKIVILAGPNGAGKTTLAREYLPAGLPFVNADLIAAERAPEDPVAAAVRAGRLMLEQLDAHARAGRSFALETTLAGRNYARRLERWRASGYVVELIFLQLPSPEMAVRRVRLRVCQGGHDIPEAVVRHRFRAGLRNFRELYSGMVEHWERIDNGGIPAALIDRGGTSPDPDTRLAADALARAARRAHLVAHRTGTRVVTARDGEAVEIDPDPEMYAELEPKLRFGI